jgi:hypothetical protein
VEEDDARARVFDEEVVEDGELDAPAHEPPAVA